jgi:hypothetical protein
MDSATALKLCEERFEAYADHVYAVLSTPPMSLELAEGWMSGKEGAGQ